MPLDFQSIAAIFFLILLSLFLYLKRKKLQKHGQFPFFYALLYKTNFGLKSMDKYAKKYNKTFRFLGYAGIIIGFLGMALLAFSLTQNLYELFTKPEAPAGVGLVLPIEARGVIFVPFFYWIIAIFIVALVHEYAHGVIARAHKIKVKSSGFGFLGAIIPILPLAFVEPDEKDLRKRPHSQQLSVFAAGPFSNILLAFVVLGISAFLFSPLVDNITNSSINIVGFIESGSGSPAKRAGAAIGESILEIEGKRIESVNDLAEVLKEKSPGSTVELKTNADTYNVKLIENPNDENSGFLGVSLRPELTTDEAFEERYGSFIPAVIMWVGGLLSWLILLNLGIGLFNLIPIGPVDGGRMMQLVLHKLFKNKKRADKIWHHISLVFLLVVVAIIFKACTA